VIDSLSDLEVLALAALVRLGPRAYGVTIREDIRERTGRSVSVGSLYRAVQRLEERGLVDTSVGEPTSVRGGRAKKYVRITPQGHAELRVAVASFRRMIEGIGPELETG
jgi:PadR family transcriptional regulator PadR